MNKLSFKIDKKQLRFVSTIIHGNQQGVLKECQSGNLIEVVG
jgi:hypothetical protein